MKEFSERQVDDLLKLKFGAVVTEHGHPSYVSNQVLGKLFNCSGSKVRQLYMARFDAIRRQRLPLVEMLRQD